MPRKKKITNTYWLYKDEIIRSVDQIPNGVYGFVYLVIFDDDKQYIGKKNIWSTRTMKPLKDGSRRPGTVDVFYKNTGKGFRQCFHRVKSESDWLTYQGSADECKDKKVKEKYILEYAYNSLELTYLENKYLFERDVLAKDEYINDNIAGAFYRSALVDYARRKEKEKDNSIESNKDEMS